jgi:undecaprenyl-diphosphatase
MYFFDSFIQNYISLIRTAHLTEYMYLLTVLFDFSLHVILMSLCVGLLVYLVRNLSYAVLFLFSLTFGAISVYTLKQIFNVSRPTDIILSVVGKSFPSGHTTIAVIFFIMLMYIFDDYLKPIWRVIFNAFCILSILLVAFSRVYLGVHWVSDILGGIILGSIISYLSVTFFKRFRLNR